MDVMKIMSQMLQGNPDSLSGDPNEYPIDPTAARNHGVSPDKHQMIAQMLGAAPGGMPGGMPSGQGSGPDPDPGPMNWEDEYLWPMLQGEQAHAHGSTPPRPDRNPMITAPNMDMVSNMLGWDMDEENANRPETVKMEVRYPSSGQAQAGANVKAEPDRNAMTQDATDSMPGIPNRNPNRVDIMSRLLQSLGM